jgi:hypothetical protein
MRRTFQNIIINGAICMVIYEKARFKKKVIYKPLVNYFQLKKLSACYTTSDLYFTGLQTMFFVF